LKLCNAYAKFPDLIINDYLQLNVSTLFYLNLKHFFIIHYPDVSVESFKLQFKNAKQFIIRSFFVLIVKASLFIIFIID
jgi:hypothetical protein